MRYVKWILAGLAGIIAYKVYIRMRGRTTGKDANVTTPDNRQPGVVDNMLKSVSGFFNFGPNPSVPTLPSAYGAVGTQPAPGSETYVATDSDHRVPEFLAGATGGHVDEALPGQAPPMPVGPPPAAGSGGYYPTGSGFVSRAYKAIGARKGLGLQNRNLVN